MCSPSQVNTYTYTHTQYTHTHNTTNMTPLEAVHWGPPAADYDASWSCMINSLKRHYFIIVLHIYVCRYVHTQHCLICTGICHAESNDCTAADSAEGCSRSSPLTNWTHTHHHTSLSHACLKRQDTKCKPNFYIHPEWTYRLCQCGSITDTMYRLELTQ